MASGSDRLDNNDGSGGNFMIGLLAGTVLGAGLAMLFAPKAGAELREQLADQASTLANQATEGYKRASQTAGQWAEKGRNAYDQARTAVVRGADEAQRYARDAADTAADVTSDTVASIKSSTRG